MTRLFENRVTPWERIGESVSGAKNSVEAIKLANLDWNVLQENVVVQGKKTKYFANYKSDNLDVLGVVKGTYKIVQNEQGFSFIDNLLGNTNLEFVKAGYLGNGERVYMVVKLPNFDLVGDEAVTYLVLTNNHDGKGAIRVACTPVRIACANMLNLAFKRASRNWSAIHTGNIDDKIEEAKKTLEFTEHYIKSLQREAENLTNKNITAGQFNDFVEQLFPIDLEEDSHRKQNNIIDLREELKFRYNNAPDLREHRGNAWGVINSVSDLISHTHPRRATSTYGERLLAKTIDGHPILDRAYSLLKVA